MELTTLSFIEHTANGCSGCGDPVNWGLRNQLLWFGEYSFFCSFCANLPEFENYIEG